MTARRHDRPRFRRRGSIYLMVLSTTTLIGTLLGGALYSQTLRLRGDRMLSDAAKARRAAESGIEVARAWIANDANWRTTRTNGAWARNLVLGEAKVDIDAIDPADGNLANLPYDGLVITSTARVGSAEQSFTVTLVAQPKPIPALAYAVHTAGQLHVRGSNVLRIGTATASTDADLRNDNVIEGNAVASTVNAAGTIYGTLQSGVAARGIPAATAPETVAALGTTIALSTNTFNNASLSPTSSSAGVANPYGVYVIRTTKDLTINSLTLNGTLVVITSGNKVTIGGPLSATPARPDLPVLVVSGDLVLQPTSGSITGLIHATGQVSNPKDITVNGAIINEMTGTDAMNLSSNVTVTYDPRLYSNPPIGYAASVPMVVQPGSFRRIVK